MKRVYDFLQNYAFAICVFLGTSPKIPLFLYANGLDGIALTYSVTLLLVSLVIFLLCFWWLKEDWVLEKKGYMMALCFGSMLGIMIGSTASLGIMDIEVGAILYDICKELPTWLLIGAMIGAVFYQRVILDVQKKT